MPYRLLAKTEFTEIREYEPVKRTICHGKFKYKYLQFPYIIFACSWLEDDEDNIALSCAFTNKSVSSSKSKLYRPALGNVYNHKNEDWPVWSVCININNNDSFDEVIEKFWNTRFSSDGGNRPRIQAFGNYKIWETLSEEADSLDRINESIKKIKETLQFSEFISWHNEDGKLNCTFDDKHEPLHKWQEPEPKKENHGNCTTDATGTVRINSTDSVGWASSNVVTIRSGHSLRPLSRKQGS